MKDYFEKLLKDEVIPTDSKNLLIKFVGKAKDLTEEEVFQKHFGGIYYIFLRGCIKDTSNGIYAQIELKETLTNDAVLYILNKVEELNMIDNIMFTSFTLSFLQLIRQYNKNVKLVYGAVSYNINKLDGFLSLGKNSGLAIREDYLTTDIINLVHSAGGFVNVWVIDDLTELNKVQLTN